MAPPVDARAEGAPPGSSRSSVAATRPGRVAASALAGLLALAPATGLLCLATGLSRSAPGLTTGASPPAPRALRGVIPLPPRTIRESIPRRESITTAMAPRTPVYIYDPAKTATPGAAVIFFSGDLGWGPLMQRAASRLADGGRAVLGVDSLTYFRKVLPADAWAGELRTLKAAINRRARLPPDAPVILAGFGHGAGMIPYIVNRAGADGVRGAVLVAPGLQGTEILRFESKQRLPPAPGEAFDVADEARRMPELPVALIEGSAGGQAGSAVLCDALRGRRRLWRVASGDSHFADAEEPFLNAVAGAVAFIESGAGGDAAPGCLAPTPPPDAAVAPLPDGEAARPPPPQPAPAPD